MSRRRAAPLAVAAAVTLGVLTASCAATTIDASAPTTTLVPETTTTLALPVGMPATLGELQTDALHLGDLIAAETNDDDRLLERMQLLWSTVSGQVKTADPDIFDDIERVMRRIATAVKRKRPADADRGARDLETLIPAFLAEHPGP